MPIETWTDARLQLLKSHFDAGLTCRQIADEIGVSRNAVIGKLSRLNLTRERNEAPPRPAKKAAKGPRVRMPPRQQYQMLKVVFSGAHSPLEPIETDRCCSLLELSAERCRWPISTPGAADFRFCGNLPAQGLPYCAGHTRLAYRPGSRQSVVRG